MPKKRKPTVADLSPDDRIARAKHKTNRLMDHALHLLNVHEANRIVLYSPTLSSQVPRSHAANAFNFFRESLFGFEVVRLCVLWDPCRADDLDKESIPAVTQLIDDQAVLDTLHERTRAAMSSIGSSALNPNSDPELRELVEQALRRSSAEFGLQQAEKSRKRLATAIRWTKRLEASPRLQALRNFRDKHLAHSLSKTRLEDKATVDNPKYGDERRLLWKAIAIVDALHHGVNETDFDWRDSIKLARDNAEALWFGCEFKGLR